MLDIETLLTIDKMKTNVVDFYKKKEIVKLGLLTRRDRVIIRLMNILETKNIRLLKT